MLLSFAACGDDAPAPSQGPDSGPAPDANAGQPTQPPMQPTEPTQQHTHEFEASVTSAECESRGFTTYTCACGESYQDDWVDATGHIFVDGQCFACGKTDPAGSATDPAEEMRPDFVAAMDSYIAFFEEYCDFMRSYMANPGNPGLAGEYIDFMQQYADTMAKLQAWENTDLNTEELKHYMEVVGEVSKVVADFIPLVNPGEPQSMRSEFKEAMDSYEVFCVEYCEMLKKYYSNPTDYTLLLQYTSMMTEYTEMAEKIQEWDNGGLNSEEMKYYIDVTTRVSQMLIDVMP